MARAKRLHVLVDGEHAGTLDRDQSRMTLTYEDDYRHSPNATPLSTSLPLGLQVHSGVPVAAYVDGLLPDSEMVRRRWAAEFHTRDTPFDLIACVGEDCAGAVQFIREERLNQLDPGGIEWLSDQEIGAWIRQLRIDPAGWLQDVEFGQFSLAGVQSKFALLHDDGRWGRPYGAIPTTHIVKPASSNFALH
ncbi:MAG: HipA N-terminal domain-containing protein [Actinomycetota bacterium]